MKLYAVKDRLIDYYLTPFVAEGDRQVLASVASTINNPETTHAIAQAPHHFEVWRLADITEDGHIQESRELLADCSSLVRSGIREATEGTQQMGTPPGRRTGPQGGHPRPTTTNPRLAQDAAQAASGED